MQPQGLEMKYVVPESYHGREQAFVKHQLLEAYLQRLFMIIGLSQNTIQYVDCFSGPWQEGSSDLSDTSIGIALKIIQKAREGLMRNGRNVRFRALFIEKDKVAYRKLKDHLAGLQQSEVTASSFPGDFFELRDSILDWCGPDAFTFFFVDPRGWKNVVEIPTLTPLLKRPNSEFMINFMYDFLSRTYSQEFFRDDMRAVFGEVLETGNLSSEQREAFLIKLYKQRLKEISPLRGANPRAVSVPVLYPTIDRTLYHLVYLTRHPRGITVFMEASEKLDLIQRRTREGAKMRETGSMQLNMFTESKIRDEKKAVIAEIKPYWLQKLSYSAAWFGVEELADMMEKQDGLKANFKLLSMNLRKREGQKISIRLARGAPDSSISPRMEPKANGL